MINHDNHKRKCTMGFHFKKSIKIAPSIKLNFNKYSLVQKNLKNVKTPKYSFLLTGIICFWVCFLVACGTNNMNTNTTSVPQATTLSETETIKETNTILTMYTTTALNVRSGPGTDYSILTTLPTGSAVNIIDKQDDWSEIEYSSESAYVFTKYLSESNTVEVASETPSETEKSVPVTMVWIPYSGSKYHRRQSCSGMKGPSQVSLEEAIRRGYSPCKKCY